MLKTTPSIEKILPYAALVLGICCLTLSSFFVHWSSAPGPLTQGYRMAIATIVLLPFYLKQRKHSVQLSKNWMIFPLLGGVFTAFDHISWSIALGITRIANATLLNYIAPLWVAFFAFFFLRQQFSQKFWIGLFLTMSGAVIVLGNDFLHHPQLSTGDVWAFFSSFFYAGYYIVTQYSRERIDTITHVWWVVFIAAVLILSFTQLNHIPLWGYDLKTYLSFLGAGIISQVGGYISIGYALGKLPASIVSPTTVAQPVLTALLAIPIANQPLMPSQIIGGFAVLIGIFLINTSSNHSE